MKAHDQDIPVAFLHECFDMQSNGALIWKARHRKGKTAGSLDKDGYLAVEIRWNGRRRVLRAHRIVWAMTTGEWPADEIDHRDGNRARNAFSNLREAQGPNQQQNMKLRRDNRSGFRGVSQPPKGRVQAVIGTKGKELYLGRFDTAEEAYAAYLAAKAKLHTFQPEPRS